MFKRSVEPVFIAVICLWSVLTSDTAIAEQSAPIISIEVDRPFVEVGERAKLSWATSRAEGCQAAGSWSGSQDKEGTFLTPILEHAPLYEFTLQCSNSFGSQSKQVFVGVVDPDAPMNSVLTTPVVTSPLVVPHHGAFSADDWVWQLDFQVNSLTDLQTLVSYDENGQQAAGHTTVSIDRKGRIKVRHQDGSSGSYTMTSVDRVSPGREHVLVLRMQAGVGMEMHLDGEYQNSTHNAFGTTSVVRDLVLAASCQSCRSGTNAPLRFPLDGEVALSILEPRETDLVGLDPASGTPDPAATAAQNEASEQQASAPESYLDFAAVNGPAVVPFQSAFSNDSIRWVATVKLNSVGTRQAIFSYDEAGQSSPGHTTLEVVANGRLRLRHQNAGSESIRLISKTKLEPNRTYTVTVTMQMGELLALDIDGNREAQVDQAYGTIQTKLPLVLGASCAQCLTGTTAPLTNVLDGSVALSISQSNSVTPEMTAAAGDSTPEAGPVIEDSGEQQDAESGTPDNSEPIAVVAPEQAPEAPVEPDPIVPEIPEPTLNLTSSASSVTAGEAVTLVWASENANECVASGAWSGSQALSGTQTVTPTPSQRSFMLQCSGPESSTLGMVTINVNRAVKVSWREPTQEQAAPVTGYRLYVGEVRGDYGAPVEIADSNETSYTLSLAPGTWFFAVTSVSGEHESVPSDVVELVIPQS